MEPYEEILEEGRNALLQEFWSFWQANGVLDQTQFIFTRFDVNVRKQVFSLDVFVHFQPVKQKGFLGGLFRSKEEKNQVVISDSYEGKTIFRASKRFGSESQVEVQTAMPANEISKTFKLRKLVENQTWRAELGC